MLVDYLPYLIGVALHKCLECRVCVVCLNVAFSDDAVACAMEVRVGNLFRASLTQLARVAIETPRWQAAPAVITLTQLMTSCTERRVALNAAICTRHESGITWTQIYYYNRCVALFNSNSMRNTVSASYVSCNAKQKTLSLKNTAVDSPVI